MPIPTDRAFLLAMALQARHLELRSWRKIARLDYQDQVSFATLNRIARSEGTWLPKDRKILVVLGLIATSPPDPEWLKRRKRQIAKLAKETRNAVLR